MTTDLKLDRLCAYPEEARFSSNDLRKTALRLPWHLKIIERKAGRKLGLLMRRAIASWLSLAESLGRTPETTVRNLIAAARLEDLPVYRIVLRWGRMNNIPPVDNGFKEIEDMLPIGGPLHRMVDSVLNAQEKPSEDDLINFFRNDPKRLATIILDNYRSLSLDLAEMLAIAIDLCDSEKPTHVSAAIGALMEIKRRRKLPPSIDEHKLALLPEVWRRTILFSSSRRSAFLLTEYRRSLESDPFQSQDMPETIRLHQSCQKALDAISRGYFGNKAIEDLLENRAEFLKISDRVAKALSKAQGLAKIIPPKARFANPAPFLHNETALALLLRCTGGEAIGSPEVQKRRPWIASALEILPDAGITAMVQRLDPEVRTKILDGLEPKRRQKFVNYACKKTAILGKRK